MRPSRVRESGGSPHTFVYHPGWHAVNTRRERVDTGVRPRAGGSLRGRGQSEGSDPPPPRRNSTTQPSPRLPAAVRTDEAGLAPAHDRLVLHHYVTKSLYDYYLKRARGTGAGAGARGAAVAAPPCPPRPRASPATRAAQPSHGSHPTKPNPAPPHLTPPTPTHTCTHARVR